MTPGPLEILAVLVVAVLMFGNRLPKVARSLGQAKSEFKKGLQEGEAASAEAAHKPE